MRYVWLGRINLTGYRDQWRHYGHSNEPSSAMKLILLNCPTKTTLLHKPGTLKITFPISQRASSCANSSNSISSCSSNKVLCGCCRVRYTEHVQLAHLRRSGSNFDTATQAWRATSRCSGWRCMWDFSTLAYPRSLRSSIVTLLQVSTS